MNFPLFLHKNLFPAQKCDLGCRICRWGRSVDNCVRSLKMILFIISKKNVFLPPISKSNAMSEILQKVQSIIADKLSVDVADVTPEKSFTNDLGADSLDTVELIMEFENAFGIKFPEEDAEKIATVGDAVAYIENLLAAK